MERLKEKFRDKTRDSLCADLCALGINAQMAERGRPEEHIIVLDRGLYLNVRRESLGLIEIRDSPIRWVNVVRRRLGGFIPERISYSNEYLVPDPNMPTKQYLKAKSVSKRNVPLTGIITDLHWEGDLEGDSIRRMNEDILLKEALIELKEDLEIGGYPDYQHWAIATKWLSADRLRVSREQWDCYETIARHLLESSGK